MQGVQWGSLNLQAKITARSPEKPFLLSKVGAIPTIKVALDKGAKSVVLMSPGPQKFGRGG